MAPVAIGAPSADVSSTVHVTDRRPCRTMVVVARMRGGAGTARTRTDMSVVNVHTSGSPSTVRPATASMT